MKYNPWLIQRGFIEDRDFKEGIDSIIRFDYMGSSEFEFGSLFRALNKLRSDIDDYIYRDIIVGNKVITIFCKKQDLEAIVKFLEKLALSEHRLQEPSYFDFYIYPEKHEMFSSLKADFWWDIDNNFMFWKKDKEFEKKFKKEIMYKKES